MDEHQLTLDYGLCRCGCGRLAPIASRTRHDLGHVRGEPVRFVSGHNPRKAHRSDAEERARAARWGREYYARNRDVLRQQMRARWHIRRGAGYDAEYDAILHLDPCAYCGAPFEQTDHIVPVSAGGDSSSSNMTAACGRCNRRKGARDLLSWLLAKNGDPG